MNAPPSVVIALGSYNSSLLTRKSSWAKKSSPVKPLIRLLAIPLRKKGNLLGWENLDMSI